MGHNIYANVKVSDNQKEAICEMIKNDNLEKAAKLLTALSQEIHLGKFNHNKKFKFALNPALYQIQNFKSIKKFINETEGLSLYEEEFGNITIEEFWNNFNKHQEYPKDDYDEITSEKICYVNRDADSWF